MQTGSPAHRATGPLRTISPSLRTARARSPRYRIEPMPYAAPPLPCDSSAASWTSPPEGFHPLTPRSLCPKGDQLVVGDLALKSCCRVSSAWRSGHRFFAQSTVVPDSGGLDARTKHHAAIQNDVKLSVLRHGRCPFLDRQSYGRDRLPESFHLAHRHQMVPASRSSERGCRRSLYAPARKARSSLSCCGRWTAASLAIGGGLDG